MFTYSLENGKKQLKQGLILLIAIAIVAVVYGLIILILAACNVDERGIAITSIIFITIMSVTGLVSAIKIIFGAVVYHAERISNKNSPNA